MCEGKVKVEGLKSINRESPRSHRRLTGVIAQRTRARALSRERQRDSTTRYKNEDGGSREAKGPEAAEEIDVIRFSDSR